MTSASHAEGRQFDPGQVYGFFAHVNPCVQATTLHDICVDKLGTKVFAWAAAPMLRLPRCHGIGCPVAPDDCASNPMFG